MSRLLAGCVGGALAFSVFAPTLAFPQSVNPRDLTQISLEDLMNIQVSSVSKRDESISKVASAIFVINSEDIRRSGANSIPDLLRMVPGVDVARINAHTWAITIRGFNERFARSVLVLIDGRIVYSPLFGGVDWDQQDVPLEDIERIEVIRGPGGTIWGANAVNGVINIITRSASDTKGGLVRAGGGSRQSASALSQYGGTAGQHGAYRIFGNYSNEGNSPGSSSADAADGWHTLHGGVRSDWTLSPRDSMTVQGDISAMSGSQTVGSPISTNLLASGVYDDHVTVSAENILGRWKRALANGSDLSLQVYYDRYNRLDTGFREKRDTADVDFHHHFKAGTRNDVVWGLGYRITSDHLSDGATVNPINYSPPSRSDSLFSAFFQDEIRLTSFLSLTIGSKLEHNGYTGFEYQPSAQLVWEPADRQEIWFSVARAIREPTRTDVGVLTKYAFVLPDGSAGSVLLTGNPDESATSVRDLELGYRVQISKRLSADVATFLSSYKNLLTVEPQAPFFSSDPTPQLVFPEQFANLEHARSYGGEVAASWNVTNRWKLSPSYSLIRIRVGLDPSSRDVAASGSADATPEHQFQIRSLLNVTRNIEWDGSLFYVSSLRGGGATPGYTRLDTRLAKRVGDSIEISVTAQNLLTARHTEFLDSSGLLHSLVARTVFGKITWRF
jgi:iron complex outermembrane receptor protein